MKKFLLAWFLSFGVMFGLAGIFNSLIIRDFVVKNIQPEFLRTPSNIMLVLLGYLLLAFLMTLVYPKVERLANTAWLSGLLFGIAAGIIWHLPYSLVLHGAYNFPPLALFIDAGWAMVEQGAGGLVIGLVIGLPSARQK